MASGKLIYRAIQLFRAPEESWVGCIRSWLAAVGSIISSIALIVAFYQFGLSRDSAQKTLRAYIGIADGFIQVITPLPDGSQAASVHVRIKNSGKTPAYDFTTWMGLPVVAESTAVPFTDVRPLSERNGSSIVFPDSDVMIEAAIRVSEEDVRALRAGSKKLFVWGGADYRDAFGVKRTLQFHDINGTERKSNIFSLQPHKRGYQAD